MMSTPLPWAHSERAISPPTIKPMNCSASGAGTDKRGHAMIYAQPGTAGAVVTFKPRYGNYIGGEFVAPIKGQYFTNTSPVNGQVIAELPRFGAEDIDKALD